MIEKFFVDSDNGLCIQKNRQIQWNKGFLIWTMAFWEKRDFLIIKTFYFPSPFFTEISLLERTQSWFVIAQVLSYWLLETHKAETIFDPKGVSLGNRLKSVWKLYERFRDLSNKCSDDGQFSQFLTSNENLK